MAKGDDYYDESGDFDNADSFDDLSRYSQADQDYIRSHSQTLIDGKPVDENGDPVKKGWFGNMLGKKTDDDGGAHAGYGKFGKKKDDDGNSKWGLLKQGEKDASKKPNSNGKGGDDKASLGEKENNVESKKESTGSKFKNAVKGVKDLKMGKRAEAKKSFKKAGPLVTIIALLLGSALSSFWAQLSMPFSLVSQFQEIFDSISVSQNMRSKNFLKWQTVKGDTVKDCIKGHYFKDDEFKVSTRQKNKLAKSGITFETDSDGITVMKHTRSNGVTQTVVADKAQAKNGRIFFEDAFDNDVEFRNSYKEGAATWRGAVGVWFDKGMTKFLNKLGIKRGVWAEFQRQIHNKQDMKNTVKNEVGGDGSAGGDIKSTEITGEGEQYKDGKPTGDYDSYNSSSTDAGNESLSQGDFKTDAQGKVTDSSGFATKVAGIADKVSKVSSVISAAVNIQCAISDVVSAVTGIVAAYQAVQTLKVAASLFEAIQKVQAGDGDGAPLHEVSESLTTPTYSRYEEVRTVKSSGAADQSIVTERTRSAMESNSIGSAYSRKAPDLNDPGVRSFNLNANLKALNTGLSSVITNVRISASAFRECAIARLGAAVAGAAVDATMIVACAVSFGIGCLVDKLADEGAQIAFQAAMSLAISTIVSFLAPVVAKVLIREIATEVVGEDLGNAIYDGISKYMSKNHQFMGGGVASPTQLGQYFRERETVIAENARYERSTRSPFDVTSKYTFLGSLMTQMVPIASNMTSLTSVVNGMSTVFNGAVHKLVPHSSAVDAGIEAQEAIDNTEEYCPEVADIGGVADSFCNPYIISDSRTMDEHPADVVNSVDNLSNNLEVDSNGNTKVVDDSRLGKYIIYCGQRSSPWGTADQNIAAEVDGAGSLGGNVGGSIIGAIPVVGDSVDIVSNRNKLANYGWITGESCVLDNSASGSESITWEEGKEYQRFIEDQRLAEAEGIVEESAVSEYISRYYEKHPIDTSYEGILARFSGMTKDKVEATLALLEVSQWVAQYDPSDYLPYKGKDGDFTKKEGMEYQFEEDEYSPVVAIVYQTNTTAEPRAKQYFAA